MIHKFTAWWSQPSKFTAWLMDLSPAGLFVFLSAVTIPTFFVILIAVALIMK
jgi:hypothetical protein